MSRAQCADELGFSFHAGLGAEELRWVQPVEKCEYICLERPEWVGMVYVRWVVQ